MSAIDVHALSSVAQVVLAQRRFADFIALLEPSYEQTRHTRVLCDHLEAVERGEIDRLVVMMPPRHGKTMHVSQALPRGHSDAMLDGKSFSRHTVPSSRRATHARRALPSQRSMAGR
jgi:hypothetical protein